MKSEHCIYIGDSRNMADIQDASVHLAVTSPPYWQLKDYGAENQIGYHHSYEDYINHLNLVWAECYRVLQPGCRLVINIGDQFARSVYYGRYKIIPIRTEIIKFCETIGFDYMGSIIWQKKTTMNTTGGATVMGSYPFPRNGIVEIDYEFILIFKKPGKSSKPEKSTKEASRLSKKEWKTYFSGHWNFCGERQDKHLAMFPEELPKRIIKMFTFEGDTVIDPFMGSGTTSLAAINLCRNSIGYEIHEDYKNVIQEKLSNHQASEKPIITIIPSCQKAEDYDKRIAKLPYVFHDPIRFDKKIDPKKLQFGSKIDKKKTKRENYFRVRQVLSPNTLELSNGLIVRLLGVEEDPGKNGYAIEYLRQKTHRQKVYMKYDKEKHDEHNHLFCYLYLSNKTFINAHLIKQGLVMVDTSRQYKHRNKFLKLAAVNV